MTLDDLKLYTYGNYTHRMLPVSRQIAFHEAGHCVIAYTQGGHPESVVMDPIRLHGLSTNIGKMLVWRQDKTPGKNTREPTQNQRNKSKHKTRLGIWQKPHSTDFNRQRQPRRMDKLRRTGERQAMIALAGVLATQKAIGNAALYRYRDDAIAENVVRPDIPLQFHLHVSEVDMQKAYRSLMPFRHYGKYFRATHPLRRYFKQTQDRTMAMINDPSTWNLICRVANELHRHGRLEQPGLGRVLRGGRYVA